MFQTILSAAGAARRALPPWRMMRRKFGVGVLGVLGVLAAGAARAAAPDDGKAQILRIEEILAAAQNATQVTPYLDPHFVWDDIVPGEWEGLPAAKAHLAAEYGAVKNLRTRIVKISADADGELGFAYSIQQISWTAASSGQKVAFITRQTDCYHKVGKSWLIVYQHVSFPVDLASGKAVLNESLSPHAAGF